MNRRWRETLNATVKQIEASRIEQYLVSSPDQLVPHFSPDDLVKVFFPYEKYFSSIVLDSMHAYAEVESEFFLQLLHSDYMVNLGYDPIDYYRPEGERTYCDAAKIMEDGFDLFTWAYMSVYEKEFSQRRYAVVNNNPYFYRGNDECKLYYSLKSSKLPIDPTEVVDSKGPIVLQDGRVGIPHMLFSVKRVPFVELAKEYDLLGRGKATGYRIKKVAGYDRRNFEAIFDPDNAHGVTPGQMFAVCLICKMDVLDAITFFHRCAELNELSDYGVPGTVLALMLKKKEYDYDTFLRVCCATYRYLKEDLPDYLSSNRRWAEAFSNS